MTRPPQLRLSLENELIVDQFAGGGGASLGIEMALGRSPDIAINHDPEAVALHQANHPTTQHHCESVWNVDPRVVTQGRPVGLMWLSPDCKHFSKAKGGKPVEKKIRGLAWIAVKWAKLVAPRVIILENVEEFQTWGPLTANDMPCPERRGLTFKRWVGSLRNLGYAVEWRELRACDYGAPTIRKRLFLVARRDGLPIVWPRQTHAQKPAQGLRAWRTAADCIDWTIPCPSIFERDRPLAENTLRRIAAGVKRYVIEAAEPFIVPITHHGDARANSVREPLRAITAAKRGEHALVVPSLIDAAHGEVSPSGVRRRGRGHHDIKRPLGTIAASGNQALVGATLIQTGYGERQGQAPRVPGLDKPLGTLVSGQKHGLVSAFLAQHNTEQVGFNAGRRADQPVSTITASGSHQQVVASHLVKLRGTCKDGQRTDAPAPTITGGGWHVGEVRAFLVKYYSEGGQWQSPGEPMHTVPTKDRMGLVTVAGEEYAIADIGMRMLQPRELYRAQGFPEDYRIDISYGGKPLTKIAQVRMCGNSVSPPVAAAIVAANFQFAQIARAA